MNIGDLVKHRPTLLPIENILRKVSSIDELEIDFCLGVIVERTINKARIFSNLLTLNFQADIKNLTRDAE